MTPDDNELARIRVLIEDLSRGMRRQDRGEPVVDVPPVMAVTESQLRKIVEESVERRVMVLEKRVEEIVHAELVGTLRRIGIRIDDDHIDETSARFIALFNTQKLMTRVATYLGLTIIGGIVLGVLKLLGLNLAVLGGEH